MDQTSPTPASSHPQPGAHVPPPAAPGAWTAPPAVQSLPPMGYAYVPPKSHRPGVVLGVISLVLSILALLGVTGIAAMMFSGGPGGDGPLTGRLPVAGAGASVGAAAFSNAIADRMKQDGASVEDMVCPAAPTVERGQVWVCHGKLDGSDWAVIVYIEDSAGTYTLNPV